MQLTSVTECKLPCTKLFYFFSQLNGNCLGLRHTSEVMVRISLVMETIIDLRQGTIEGVTRYIIDVKNEHSLHKVI